MGPGGRPPLEHLLAEVRQGRSLRLELTKEQASALRRADPRLRPDDLRTIVQHFLAARAAAFPDRPEPFPLTQHAVQAVARKLGVAVGLKRCRRIIRGLLEAGVIERAGSYMRRRGERNRVRLYRVACFLARLRGQRPGGRGGSVKGGRGGRGRPRWWEHPLFGDYRGRPPPEFPKDWRKNMRSLDELGISSLEVGPDGFYIKNRRRRDP